MTAPHLRPARTTDAGKVGHILSEFIDGTPWMPRLYTRAQDIAFAGDLIDKGCVSVAAHSTRVTGFIAHNAATIEALYVAGDVRRRGIGSALLQHMQAGCDALTLWTFQANTQALAFYACHGFAPVEKTDGAGNDEGLPDIRLAWKKEGS